MIKRIILVAILMIMALPASGVLAIGAPTTLGWGSGSSHIYKVFTNVQETGDMLFAANVNLEYTVEPTDYTASEAFLFQILNPAGNVTLASTTMQSYGNRPISIYLSADQVSSLGLVSGTAYGLRVTGNPSIFPSQNASNTMTAFLASASYIDQSTSGNSTLTNHLRNFMMLVALDIEDEDNPTPSYITTIQGIKYLSAEGANIFLEGVPGLDSMCQPLFLYALESLGDDQPTSTGSYAALLTPSNQWGTNTANGLTALGVYMGINQNLAGASVAFGLGIILAIYVYKRIQSGVATLMLMATYPFAVAWLGLMPLALAFIIMILVVILGGMFFWKQGAL